MTSSVEQPAEHDVPRSGVPQHLADDMTVAEQGEWLGSLFRRTRVTRRSALAGSIGTFGILAMGHTPQARAAGRAVAGQAAAAGTTSVAAGRHLGFGDDPSTSMWVTAELFDTSGTRPSPSGTTVKVVYGLTTSYGQTVTADIRRLDTTVPTDTATSSNGYFALTQYFAHALLKGLSGGTTYHWAFQVNGVNGPDAAFTTAPTPGSAAAPFTFTAIADQGINVGGPALAGTPYLPNSGTAASSDYYSSTGTISTNPPKDPADTASDRATTGRRKDGSPNRTTNPAASVTNVIATLPVVPAFNLIGGDIAYADPAGNGLAAYYAAGANPGAPASTTTKGYPDTFDPTVWSAYFVQNESMGAQTAQMFALGNHDQEAVYDGDAPSNSPQPGYLKSTSGHGYGGHAARINLLGGSSAQYGSPSPSVYAFRHSNVGVVAIDCNDLSQEIQSNTGYSGGAQAAWLDAQLNRFRQDSTIDFVVAFFHHCAFATSSNHHSDSGVRATVAPLFDKYQVDVVFQGHNHQYERTDPLRYQNGAPVVGTKAADQSTVAGWQGTTYINNGNAGRPRYGIDPDVLVKDTTLATANQGYTERFRGNPNVQGSESINGQLVTGITSSGAKVLAADPVTWSQARYDDYGVVVIDVVPAKAGGTTSMTVRELNDFGVEIDRVVLSKVAGKSPTPALPEIPTAVLLPAAGLAVAGGYVAHHRHHGSGQQETAPSV